MPDRKGVSTLRIHPRKRIFVGAAIVVAAALACPPTVAAQTAASDVTVVVDGSPVSLDQPPVMSNGRILVPLRGVFQRLGAIVTWDPGSQTVLAQRGPTSISLTIGSLQAFVNGQPQTLDTPAVLVDGHTMVPLRFIAQALGAGVGWIAATNTVQITTQGEAAPPAGGPAPEMYAPVPPVSQVQTITGTVTQVIAYAYPGGLTIQTPDGALYTYRVVSATAITRVNRATGFSGPVALSAIQPGDAVTITADPTGTAQTVQALTDPAAQTRPRVPAPPVVRTNTGTVAQVNASAYPGQLTVQLPDGNLYTYRVLPRTAITRTNTTTGRGGSVPLGAIETGDAATVTADRGGTAESIQAAFAEITGTIARLERDRIMLRDGHTYRLDSTAQISRFGQILTAAALQPGAAVTLRVNPETWRVYGVTLLQAPSAPATSPVAAPSGGRRVDAPVITSPASGAAVTAPFTVTGTAQPRARVTVAAEYSQNLLGAPSRGSLGAQTVTVDAKGNWSATFGRTAPVRDVKLTITAVIVDDAGADRSAPATLTTTLH
jgi:Copper amine oxidase N-terminal domain